jgi:hypothetical protein
LLGWQSVKVDPRKGEKRDWTAQAGTPHGGWARGQGLLAVEPRLSTPLHYSPALDADLLLCHQVLNDDVGHGLAVRVPAGAVGRAFQTPACWRRGIGSKASRRRLVAASAVRLTSACTQKLGPGGAQQLAGAQPNPPSGARLSP